MKVLSLFDGISCGRLALQRARIKVDKYYASEINPYAIKIAQNNFPDTIQLGDVEKLTGKDLGHVDLLIGGSPCQSFSQAGDGSGFDGKSKLFWEYVRLLKELREINPDILFLLENVPMKEEWERVITEQLGVVPHRINSALVSAQNRNRLYWTNITDWSFEPPVDKAVYLESTLLPKAEVPESLWLSENEKNYMDRAVKGGRTHWDFQHHSDTENGKSACVVSNFLKGVPYNVLIDRRDNRCFMYDCDFQDNVMNICSDCDECDSHQNTNCPTATVRKFHPVECERLQTLPDNYTAGVSNTRRYEAIGNGWTVDIIAHIFTYLK